MMQCSNSEVLQLMLEYKLNVQRVLGGAAMSKVK